MDCKDKGDCKQAAQEELQALRLSANKVSKSPR